MKKFSRRKKKKVKAIRIICWLIIPTAMIIVLVFDRLNLYSFNTERLIVIGTCIFVVLIPFLKEITVKDFSLKKATTPNTWLYLVGYSEPSPLSPIFKKTTNPNILPISCRFGF